jgi:hypothetical protein
LECAASILKKKFFPPLKNPITWPNTTWNGRNAQDKDQDLKLIGISEVLFQFNAIYFDTPSKFIWQEDRAFSHGCIRVKKNLLP